MASTWTVEQVIALAPDASSVTAGRGLATPGKWVTLGRAGDAIWGECKGSGSSPYQTQIDTAEPGFKCSCPSRKFPCKHALGLFLQHVAQPNGLKESEPPEWVAKWLAGRAQRAEKQAEKANAPAAAPDPAAQAKRAAQRETRVAAGLADLQRWVRDLVRQGLATVQDKPYAFWDGPAARLVDAQAPGLARIVRDLAGLPSTGEGWQERLLDRLCRLHLLIRGYERIEALPPDTQADIRSAIGWTMGQDEVLAGEGVRDTWLILGRRVDQEDRLRVQRTWLQGAATGRPALVLSFAAAGQALETALAPGRALDAELVFYPGSFPLRALIKTRQPDSDASPVAAPHPDVTSLAAAYGAAVARNPWIEQLPGVLGGVVPFRVDGRWQVRDAQGRCLPVASRFTPAWELAAMSGGRPIEMFGEWDGYAFLPLSARADGRFYPFALAEGGAA